MPTCLDCEIRVPPVEEWERVTIKSKKADVPEGV
jgi:hypothetical protein